MSQENDITSLPFADDELVTDVYPNAERFQQPKRRHKSKMNPTLDTADTTQQKKTVNPPHKIPSYLYFENIEKETNVLTLIPYTGPCNTAHLGINLYLPHVTATTASYSSVDFQRFVDEYTQTMISMKSSSETTPLSVYIRFGILYVLLPNLKLDRSMALKDFLLQRHAGKQVKTAFYTCKGVTTPKTLLAAITKLNYQLISSNTYSYAIQLYGTKNNPHSVLLFRYDEQLRCQDICYQANYPTNFNFIRNKTSSKFRSLDHSYADIFDFRVQLTQAQYVSKTDPHVLEILRDVPIDSVLSFDSSTRVLCISPKLHKFVKYFKCTRSSNYQNFDDQTVLSVGTYEEFQMNSQSQCEALMTASNTMTMEFIDRSNTPSAKKLYDTGMWFSTLCQTCVELPSVTLRDPAAPESSRWFSGISVFRKKYDQTVAHVDVNELTKYTTKQYKKKTCTSEDITLIKKIFHEENQRSIFFDAKEEIECDRLELDRRWHSLKRKLQTTAAPSANQALKKAQRAYYAMMRELD